MKATGGRLGHWLIVSCALALLWTGTGCSMLIASMGVSSVPGFAPGSSREAVRKELGPPDASEARVDGTRVDTYHVRRRVSSLWAGVDGQEVARAVAGSGQAGVLVVAGLLIYEGVATGKALYDSEQQKAHLAFVFGRDDALLYDYELTARPEVRFEEARHPLAEPLWQQIERGGCPRWSACLTSYVEELRRRAATVAYPLPPEEEENFHRLLEVAGGVDEGSLTKGEALMGIAGRDHAPCTSGRAALDEALWKQLETAGCPSWARCMSFYGEELRRRPAAAGSPQDEVPLARLLEIARDVDEGRSSPGEGFIGMVGHGGPFVPTDLEKVLWRQLETDRCPKWNRCVARYVEERRMRQASVTSPPSPVDEEALQRFLDVAQEADEGKIPREEALLWLRSCSSYNPLACQPL